MLKLYAPDAKGQTRLSGFHFAVKLTAQETRSGKVRSTARVSRNLVWTDLTNEFLGLWRDAWFNGVLLIRSRQELMEVQETANNSGIYGT